MNCKSLLQKKLPDCCKCALLRERSSVSWRRGEEKNKRLASVNPDRLPHESPAHWLAVIANKRLFFLCIRWQARQRRTL